MNWICLESQAFPFGPAVFINFFVGIFIVSTFILSIFSPHYVHKFYLKQLQKAHAHNPSTRETEAKGWRPFWEK